MIVLFVYKGEEIKLNNELVSKSIEELSVLIQQKEISPVELVNQVINQAESHNKEINAFINITKNNVKKAALESEKEIMNGHYRGKMHGIPIGIKDNINIKNELTTMGSKIHKDFIAKSDATVIKKLREAGSLFVGKLNMHEYAFGGTTNNPHFGACRNPWNLQKSPGGSSGGSGAAVAMDMCIAALGTDTMGSVRMPSSACGIVGLKPTQGRVSNYGCFPSSRTLDHIGPMTKTVTDSAIMLGAISGYDKKDLNSVDSPSIKDLEFLTGDIRDLTIGVNEEYFFNKVDSEIEILVRKGIESLIDLGARVEEVEIPSLKHIDYAGMITTLTEGSDIHQHNMRIRPDDYGDDIRILFELGELPSATDYIMAQQIRSQLKYEFTKIFEEINILVSPTLPIQVPDVSKEYSQNNVDIVGDLGRFTGIANLTGLPSLTLPCGFKDGIPVGLQLIGKKFAELEILNVGYAYEMTDPLKGKKPNLIAN